MEHLPDEITLSLSFLKKQKACTGLPEEQLVKMCEEAIAIGASHAGKYRDWDIYKALKEYKVKAEMSEGGVYGSRLVRAQYDDSVKTVFLYKAGVDSMVDTGAGTLLGVENTEDKMREILLWHEFFHVLEFKVIGLVGKRFPLPQKVLCFNVNKPFYPISEICANAFAMRVMGLKHNPFIIDHLLHNSEAAQTGKEE